MNLNRKTTLLSITALFLGLGAMSAWAQSPELPAPAADEARDAAATLPEQAASGLDMAAEKTAGLPAEATIRLMGEADADLPDAVLNEIALPELPESSHGADGLATAQDNIARRDVGQDVAEGALDNARDNANSMADEALEKAEQRGRSEEHMPEDVPGPPGPPDTPAP